MVGEPAFPREAAHEFNKARELHLHRIAFLFLHPEKQICLAPLLPERSPRKTMSACAEVFCLISRTQMACCLKAFLISES